MMIRPTVIDLGPGAGEHGGATSWRRVLPKDLLESGSMTAKIPARRARRQFPGTAQRATGTGLTLKGRQATSRPSMRDLPIGHLHLCHRVSGSERAPIGDTLLPHPQHTSTGARHVLWEHEGIDGLAHLDKRIEVDQAPHRAQYPGPITPHRTLSDHIRDHANLLRHKIRGYKRGRFFPFNTPGGAAETCKGTGGASRMNFLPDVSVPARPARAGATTGRPGGVLQGPKHA